MKKIFALFVALPFVAGLSCAQPSSAVQVLSPAEFRERLQKDPNAQLVDVRTPGEFAGGHLENAVNINLHSPDFVQQLEKLDKSAPVYVYCLVGGRSAEAAGTLEQMGFTAVYDMKGGIRAWQAQKLPLAGGVPSPAKAAPEKAVTQAQLDSIVKTGKPVLVDFYATWCAPCKKMEPTLNQLEREGQIHLVRVDIEVNRKLSNDYRVDAIPLLLAYNNGKLVMRMEGLQTRESILKVYGK